MRLKRSFGSHLPVLIRVMQATTGPVVEIGGGFFSTPVLHWMCCDQGRMLVTYDNDPATIELICRFRTRFHAIHLVSDWDTIDLSTWWSVALIDHRPSKRRWRDVLRVKYADYIVVHDTQDQVRNHYGYDNLSGKFRYEYRYARAKPQTTVYSNQHDPAALFE